MFPFTVLHGQQPSPKANAQRMPTLPAAVRSARAEEAALPLPHRLAIAYLTLPLLIWLPGWLEWWIGVPSAIALAWALQRALRGRWITSPARWPWGLLLFAALWTATAAIFGTHRGDWAFHAAELLDLQRGPWPTYVVDHIADDPPLLRYYLGWHMVPAGVAKWFGAATLNWTVPLWTWAGLALVLALFARGLSRARAVAVAVAVAFFFSGVDVVEYAVRFALSWQRLPPVWDWNVLEGDMWDWTTVESPMKLEYQSQAMTFGYSPQHFIAAGLGTLLLVQLRRRRRFLGVVGVVLVACAFWSTLVSAALLPFAGALLLANGPRGFPNWRNWRSWLTWQNLLVGPLLLGIVGLYLTAGKLDFPSGWLWTLYDNGWRAIVDVAIAYACEFLLLAGVLWRLKPKIGRDPFFLSALAILVVAPWWYYGSEVFSELLVRITIPPLFLLSYVAARTLAAYVVRARRRAGGEPAPRREVRSPAPCALVCVLALGAASALAFHAEMLRWPGLLRYDRTGYSSYIDSYYEAGVQRLVRDRSGLLAAVLRDNDGPDKGQLLFQSAAQPFHEAWLLENRLLFVTRRLCRRGEKVTRFLVRLHTDAGRDPVRGARSVAKEQRLDFDSRSSTEHKCCNNCVWPLLLSADASANDSPALALAPRLEFDRIVAGQLVDGTLRWMAEFRFAAGRHVATDTLFDDSATAYRAKYAAWMRRPPVAAEEGGEGWKVRLADGVVAYTKAPCVWADDEPRFLLHGFPQGTLREERRVAGFENLDFDFDEGGVVFDGKCLVERPLPSYALRALRTGQFGPEGEILWRAYIPAGDGG